MVKELVRYSFKDALPAAAIENVLILAIIATESLYGESSVRLDIAYYFDPEGRTCVIRSSSKVGSDLCKLFTGLATREFGEAAFSVQRIEPSEAAEMHLERKASPSGRGQTTEAQGERA